MNSVMTFFVIVAFLGTIAVLVAGGISMARGGKFDTVHVDEFWEGRILMQAITLVLIVVAVLAFA
jgi:hypothetical protein